MDLFSSSGRRPGRDHGTATCTPRVSAGLAPITPLHYTKCSETLNGPLLNRGRRQTLGATRLLRTRSLSCTAWFVVLRAPSPRVGNHWLNPALSSHE